MKSHAPTVAAAYSSLLAPSSSHPHPIAPPQARPRRRKWPAPLLSHRIITILLFSFLQHCR
eukprot:XP_001689459.1 predicted protein [Chlamydomonas reinhardtii]